MTKMAKEFKEFITRGNVVELACAVVLGVAFKAVIDAFIAGVVNPIIAAIFGKPNLDQVMTWEIRNGAVLSIGVVLTQVLSFVLVALGAVLRDQGVQQAARAGGGGRHRPHRGRAAHRDPRRCCAIGGSQQVPG